jgi:hypothetical protein
LASTVTPAVVIPPNTVAPLPNNVSAVMVLPKAKLIVCPSLIVVLPGNEILASAIIVAGSTITAETVGLTFYTDALAGVKY